MNEALKRAKRELERAGYEVRPQSPVVTLPPWQQAAQQLAEAAATLYQEGDYYNSWQILLRVLSLSARNGAAWWGALGVDEAVQMAHESYARPFGLNGKLAHWAMYRPSKEDERRLVEALNMMGERDAG